MRLFIKNMVCARCKWAVRKTLQEQGFTPLSVELGEAEIAETPDAAELDILRTGLAEWGFVLLDDHRAQTVEQIKSFVINEIHYADTAVPALENLSDRLAATMGRDYGSLSRLFSEVEDMTIEQFVIRQRIERVKELLVYGEQTLSEIAWLLGYSSVAHLSRQFKQITGFTSSHYRALKQEKRKALDEI